MRRGRPIELPGAWGVAARAIGGVKPLAALLGRNVRTLERWAKGGCPLAAMDDVESVFTARRWALPTFEESKCSADGSKSTPAQPSAG
jgi:hypothetical protein